MNVRYAIGGIALVAIGIAVSNALFTVSETEQAIVLQFGDPRQVIREPGLHVKIPFVQEVRRYEKRVLDVNPPVEQVILADQRRLDVDAFVRYRIVDPLRFFQTVNNESTAHARISTITNAALRRVLGNATQLEVLSEERAQIMNAIRDIVDSETTPFGMEIVDVRLGRADVPEGTVQSVYDRMRSEREREAAEFRAQGEEQAQQIRSRADRERTVILAEAEREAQILRGEGDAEAIRILADAFGQDADFFAFYRTLQAYRQSLSDDDTSLVLSPTGQFFRFFQSPDGVALPQPSPEPPQEGEPRASAPAGPSLTPSRPTDTAAAPATE